MAGYTPNPLLEQLRIFIFLAVCNLSGLRYHAPILSNFPPPYNGVLCRMCGRTVDGVFAEHQFCFTNSVKQHRWTALLTQSRQQLVIILEIPNRFSVIQHDRSAYRACALHFVHGVEVRHNSWDLREHRWWNLVV